MMKSVVICLGFMVSCLNIYSQEHSRLSLGQQPVYKVFPAGEKIVIDGKNDEMIWRKAEAREFNNHYREEKPSDRQKSSFRMVRDAQYLYVFFEFEDQFLTARETNPDSEPYLDDCAEIFIIPAPDSLDSHIGFELNIYKASNDFIYFNNYYQDRDYVLKGFDPEFNAGVTYSGSLNDNSDTDQGWTLELAIPFDNFRNLPNQLFPGDQVKWAFQAVRQDRNEVEGSRISTSTLFPIYDISKGVHQVNRFGLMEFSD